MNKEYDEVLAEILIQLDQIEKKMEKAEKRMDLTIRRLVKMESRMEKTETNVDNAVISMGRFLRDQTALNTDINAKLLEIIRKIA